MSSDVNFISGCARSDDTALIAFSSEEPRFQTFGIKETLPAVLFC